MNRKEIRDNVDVKEIEEADRKVLSETKVENEEINERIKVYICVLIM